MNTKNQLAATVLKASDNDYFSDDNELLFIEAEERLANTNYNGVLIYAPNSINVEDKDHLPVLVGIRVTNERATLDEEKNGFLFCVNLNTGELKIARAYFDPKDYSLEKKETEPKKAYSGNLIKVSKYDAKTRLRLDWKGANLAIGYFSYELNSNVVMTQLIGTASLPGVPLTDIFPEQNINVVEDGAGNLFPSYLRQVQSPKLSDEQRLEAKIIFNTEKDKGPDTIAVYCSFRQPFRNRLINLAKISHSYAGTKVHQVQAIVPVSVLLVKKDNAMPELIKLKVPVYSDEKFEEGSQIEGYFAVDLNVLCQGKELSGEYAVHIIVEDSVCGGTLIKFPQLYPSAVSGKL